MTERRNFSALSRDELERIHVHSTSYRDKYHAGRALRMSPEILDDQMNSWLTMLRDKTRATRQEEHRAIFCSYEKDWGDATVKVVDQERRLEAVAQAGELLEASGSPAARNFLKRIYDAERSSLVESGAYEQAYEYMDLHTDPDRGFASRMRAQAGRALGYSPLRITLHEGRDIIGGTAMAAGIAGLFFAAYTLLQ